jgi:protein phosphatase 1 regulatory subunit 42
MTVELLCRCTGQTRRKRGESEERLLQRVTHLYCSDKGVHSIDGLSNCHALSVLYLYDNLISQIAGLASCRSLTHLYLQNNHISRIEGLDNLHRLSKLYLSDNALMVVEGLEQCPELTELHVANQRLPEGEKLLFDPRTLKAIAPSLVLLNVSGDCLDSLEDLSPLTHLTTIIATDNHLSSMKDLSQVLSHWSAVQRVELAGNPLCNKHKYRDRVITMGARIGMVDGREVSDTERQFLASWKATRKARRKALHQNIDTHGSLVPSAHCILSSQPPPLTMPALPARSPIRHWRKGHMHQALTGQQSISLPTQAPPQSAFAEFTPSHPIKHTPTSSHIHKGIHHTITTGTVLPQIVQPIIN